MKHKRIMCVLALTMAASLMLSIAACNTVNNVTSDDTSSAISVQSVNEDGISNYNDGEHAIEVSGKTEEYSNVTVTKTGSSSSGDEADFYGDNAAIFATEKATLTLTLPISIRSNSIQTSLWKMQCSETSAPGTPTHLTMHPAFINLALVLCHVAKIP